MALPGKPARPCPLPLLPSAGAPLALPASATRPGDPGVLPEERRRPRLGHRRAESAAAAPCPVPVVGGRWSRRPAPAPRGSAHSGIAPSPAGPGRATAGSSAPEPRPDGGMRFSQPPGFVRGRSKGRGSCTDLFLRLAWVCPPRPVPFLGRGTSGSFGWGRRGARGERAGAPPGAMAGCGLQVSGQASARRSTARPPRKPAPSPGAANNPHGRSGKGRRPPG